VTVEPFSLRLTAENARDLVRRFDIHCGCCRQCGRPATAQRHSPMAIAGCCYEHVPAAPGDLSCPATCFSPN
jgi:hypothetical protein